jgi:GNAT superfamily N-acetyltransferase
MTGGKRMSRFNLTHSYIGDGSKRESLITLFQVVFGFSPDFLRAFYEKGYWDPSYRPFSYFDGQRAVANVSIFDMPLVINGKEVKAAGIQSVMTHPDYRRKGLIRRLFHELFEQCRQEYDLFFLVARDPELYLKFDFHLVPQSHFVCEEVKKLKPISPMVPLNVHHEEDCRLLKRLFRRRTPVSNVFGFVDHQSTFFLNMFSGTKTEVAYLPSLDIALVYSLKGSVLHLYDVVGGHIPPLDVICSSFDPLITKAEIYFSPDLLQTEYIAQPPHTHAKLMVRGEFPVKDLLFEVPPVAIF